MSDHEWLDMQTNITSIENYEYLIAAPWNLSMAVVVVVYSEWETNEIIRLWHKLLYTENPSFSLVEMAH